ncbi:GntR family transcriptional regulator [Aliamphritea spongicola]|uniref:GntR family transcriptional regulator n=1 Tax=Aliamphritea spongicola TaxID=707589 RepID=UPI00196AD291|nr:GntR family transcriptional regulator [Aliamphritea spongicola]MBN3563794.1 GntR family transcriptional regulator [Aliamphritea spongicola]
MATDWDETAGYYVDFRYNPSMQTSLEKKTKAELAAELLEAAIISCDLEPGSVMTETEVSEYLDLGRTPVREALTRLANENLVRLSRAGVVIPELNPMTMLKLLEPRSMMERLCIEKAIERMVDEDRARITPVIDALQALDNGDRKGFMAQLREIHNILADSSKNEFILDSIKSTQGLSRRFWYYYATDEDQAYCTDLYVRQLQALLSGDETTSMACSAELMQYLQNFARQQLEQFR